MSAYVYRCRAGDDGDVVRSFVECGVERCRLHRTLGSVDLLLRCLEQRCASALPRGTDKAEAGTEKGEGEWRACAEACRGSDEAEYLECLRQTCGSNRRTVHLHRSVGGRLLSLARPHASWATRRTFPSMIRPREIWIWRGRA